MAGAANRVLLDGEVRGSVRHGATPAGLPVVRFELGHRSTQTEAGAPMRVACRVAVVACGEAAPSEGALAAGDRVRVEGFLAAARGGGLVIRARRIERLDREGRHGGAGEREEG